MNPSSTLGVLAAIAGFCSISAQAEDAVATPTKPETLLQAITDGKPMTNFRLRYENVDQDAAAPGLKNANAWTLRSLVGWQTAPFHDFSVGAQLIGVTKLDNEYNDFKNGINQPGKSGYAIVNDPSFFNVNQLYLDWTGIPDTKIRAGRQSLKIDNVRMIGNIEFRQVMQVFDGVTVENKSLPNTEILAGYYTRLRKINTDLRPDDTGILHAAYKLSPTETLTAYAYWYDMDHIAPTSTSNVSNRTVGLRADGHHKIDDHWKVLYTAEYAKQDPNGDSDQRKTTGGSDLIDTHYYKLGLGAGWDNWFARIDQELLSSNNGQFAFQTPLGTNHLFQGWVDKFLVTPAEGIRDTFITAGGKVWNVTLLTEYHWIDSDKDFARVGGGLGDRYGTEWDISAAYAYDKHLSGKIEYGAYHEEDQRAAGRIRDTDKLWLTVMYAF